MMPGHSCCTHMLINIFLSLLPIPWWLEDSAAVHIASSCQLNLPQEGKLAVWGGGQPQRRTEESLWGPPESLCCFCHKEFCKGHRV